MTETSGTLISRVSAHVTLSRGVHSLYPKRAIPFKSPTQVRPIPWSVKQNSANMAIHYVYGDQIAYCRFRRIEALAHWLLLAVVTLAPLPFGSNGPESMVVLAGLSGLVLMLVSSAMLLKSEPIPAFRARPLIIALIAFAVFGIWVVIQVIPGLPTSLPHPLWTENAKFLGAHGGGGMISIDPELTWHALVRPAAFSQSQFPRYCCYGTRCADAPHVSPWRRPAVSMRLTGSLN